MSIKQMLKETADEVEVEGPCTVFSGRCSEILPASGLSSIFHSGWMVCSSKRYRKTFVDTVSMILAIRSAAFLKCPATH